MGLCDCVSVISSFRTFQIVMLNEETRPLLLAVPVCAAALTAGYVAYRLWKSHKAERRINPMIQLDSPKVTDVFDIEELAKRIEPGKKISLCRCWKSQKWPYCDGAH